MGCDIHAFHEQFINNKWEYIEEIDLWRNYVLFTVLANVRSGEDRVKIISTPKGLPNDLSDEVRAEVQSWNGDGHSHSWLTKQEFFDFNWECDIFLNGFVDEQEYKTYIETGAPTGWCKGIGGQKTKIVSEEEMKSMIKEKEISYYCHITWKQKLIDFVEKSYQILYDIFSTEPESRIIFWFDN